MKDLATSPPGGEIDDDGFSTSSCSSGRGFDFLRWKADSGWVDRDGVTAPSPMLAVKVDEILRMWKDDRPTDITEKPLPDPDTLNAQILVSEWEEASTAARPAGTLFGRLFGDPEQRPVRYAAQRLAGTSRSSS
jgi:hypothetical protein